MRKSPRDRRLNSDFQSVQELQEQSTIFSFHASGNPPQKYRLIFKGAGLQRDRHGTITISEHHEVLVELGAAYPRMVPNLAWQTPTFHPNISNNGVVCLGGYGTHWVPSLTLSEMCTMLWDMIRYKNFDSESPYNREAAHWAKIQTDFQLPLDGRSIRDQISNPEKAAEPPPISLVAPVTRVPSDVATAEPVEDDGIIVDGIEIIETGIEILKTNLGQSSDQPRDRNSQSTDGGIIFLD